MAKKKSGTVQSISPAETEILRIIWQVQPTTVQQVCDSLPKGRDISYATVQTLIRRLEKKGYVRHKVHGKAHVFSAAKKPEQVIKRSVGDFVDRLFGGDPFPLMMHLVDESKLDEAEITRLKTLIKKLGKNSGEDDAGDSQ